MLQSAFSGPTNWPASPCLCFTCSLGNMFFPFKEQGRFILFYLCKKKKSGFLFEWRGIICFLLFFPLNVWIWPFFQGFFVFEDCLTPAFTLLMYCSSKDLCVLQLGPPLCLTYTYTHPDPLKTCSKTCSPVTDSIKSLVSVLAHVCGVWLMATASAYSCHHPDYKGTFHQMRNVP